MQRTEIEIVNKLGMHARAAAKFVTLAQTFSADIKVNKDGQVVNGKSIMGVMMLAASQGNKIELVIDGEDEQQATQSLSDLINNRFDEDE